MNRLPAPRWPATYQPHPTAGSVVETMVPATYYDKLEAENAELRAKVAWMEGDISSVVGWPWDAPFEDGRATEREAIQERIDELEAQVESLQNRWASRPLAHPDGEALEAENARLMCALGALVTYTEACEGLLNATPSCQVVIARAALSAGEQR